MDALEFEVNEFITLKLVENRTIIYIKGEEFIHCKFLLIINPQENRKQEQIDSIDEAGEYLSRELESSITPIELGITPEQEFWGHCSNLQAWVESSYDTRLLHSNISFPLLKKLTSAGDPQARRVFKDEIVKRFMKGYLPVAIYLLHEGYLEFLNAEEVDSLLEDFDMLLDEPTFRKRWDDHNIWNNLGAAFHRRDEYELAHKMYRNAIEIAPENTMILYNIALIYEDLTLPEKAIETYKHIIEIDPEHVDSLNNLGYNYNDIGKFDNAIEVLKKCVEVDPENSDAWNNLGISYYRKGDLERAKEYYEKTLECNQRYHLAYSNLSEVYDMYGDYDKATELASKALEIEPSNYEGLYFYAHGNYKKGKYKRAIEHYKEALKVSDKEKQNFTLEDNRIWYQMAKSYFKSEIYGEALNACNECLKLKPNHKAALNLKEKIKELI